MKIKGRNISWWLSALLSGMAIVLMPTLSRAAGDVDEARLKAADSEPQNWFTLGRDSNQTYFSPLSTINEGNVGCLGFAWASMIASMVTETSRVKMWCRRAANISGARLEKPGKTSNGREFD
jgi:glucose dehydrogenase